MSREALQVATYLIGLVGALVVLYTVFGLLGLPLALVAHYIAVFGAMLIDGLLP